MRPRESSDWVFSDKNEIKPAEPSILSKENIKEFKKIIPHVEAVIAKDLKNLNACNVRYHEVKTGNVTPIYISPYRKSMAERELIQEHVKEMLDANIIRPSSSPWSSPVIMIPKPDGSIRFCVDYRKLNACTENDHFPMPRIDDIFDALEGSLIYSTLDLKSGYWQILMDENSIEKTAFSTPDGHYEFIRMPFGLKTAPSNFSRIMHMVLGHLPYVQIYLDDITIHSKSFQEHMDHIKQVCGLLKKAKLSLNLKKCNFCSKEIKILGHIISYGKVLMDPKDFSFKGSKTGYLY